MPTFALHSSGCTDVPRLPWEKNNLSNEIGIQVRLCDEGELFFPNCRREEGRGGVNPKIIKQLVPRTKEQVTGCRWLQWRWGRESNTLEMKIHTRFCEVSLDT